MNEPTKHRFPYDPNYAAPPGSLLQDYLEALGISAREFARRCGRSPKLISEILSNKAPVEPETALQFERVLGADAAVWLGMEAGYRLYLARCDEDTELEKHFGWAEKFPLKDLQRLGFIQPTTSKSDRVRQLLRFFGAGSVSACRERFSEMLDVAFRHSPSFESHKEALVAWLRIGQIRAEAINCRDYDRTRFQEALKSVRSLTEKPFPTAVKAMIELCGDAGVAFAVVPPLEHVALSGISRWLNPKKALIQQTLRHRTNDHFWFTFFHECAHLILHSRKTVYIDEEKSGNAEPHEEEEANEWASDFLVPESDMTRFIVRFTYREEEVIQFAREQGIAPGIVVGQLQHRKVLRFSQMNRLRERYDPHELGAS